MVKNIHKYKEIVIFEDNRRTMTLTKLQYQVLKYNLLGMNVDEIIDRLGLGHGLDDIKYDIVRKNIEGLILDCKEKNLSFDKNVRESGEFSKEYPKCITIELTDFCNFHCSHCYKDASDENNVFLGYEELDDLLEIMDKKCGIVHFTGGEPFTYKGLDRIIEKYATEYLINITSNGSLINSISIPIFKKINNIQVSIYGRNEQIYREITGKSGMFDRVISNLAMLRENDISFTIGINFCKDLCMHTTEYVKLLDSLNAKYVIFGEVGNNGRGKDNEFWKIEKETLKRCKKIISKKMNTPNNVSIMQQKEIDSKHECTAGTLELSVSETGKLLFCNMLDHNFFEIGECQKIMDYCESTDKKELFENRILSYKKMCNCNKDICPRLDCNE